MCEGENKYLLNTKSFVFVAPFLRRLIDAKLASQHLLCLTKHPILRPLVNFYTCFNEIHNFENIYQYFVFFGKARVKYFKELACAKNVFQRTFMIKSSLNFFSFFGNSYMCNVYISHQRTQESTTSCPTQVKNSFKLVKKISKKAKKLVASSPAPPSAFSSFVVAIILAYPE